MRTTFALLMLIHAVAALAQPDPWLQRLSNPCGLPPNDSVDVTSDGIPDLLIRGWSMGTCDVPSSAGSCRIHVVPLAGTQLLCGLDALGSRVPQAFAKGDTIPLATSMQDDLRIPRLAFADALIDALGWSYGRSGPSPIAMPELPQKVFVFSTITGHQVVRGSFTIEQLPDLRSVHIHASTLGRADKPMIVR